MIYVQSVIINASNIVLKVGGWYYGAYATVCPTDATCKSVTWHSDNTNVATVNPDNGYVYANAPGTAKIYATATDGSACSDHYIITVVPVYAEGIMVCPETLTMKTGESYCLEATVYPTNTTNKAIAWTSGDYNITDVDSNGCVTAKAAGTTYICANAIDGSGVTGCCEVTVNELTEDEKNALVTKDDCYVRLDTSLTTDSILEGPDNHDVVLRKGDKVYLLHKDPFDDQKWYRILYDGMMVYVTNDGSFEEITLPPLEAPTGCDVTVRKNEGRLEVRCMPSETAEVLGTFSDGATVILTNETPQNETWYPVYGQLDDGTFSYGWCEGWMIATSIYEHTLNVRKEPDPINAEILGSIKYGEEVRLIKANDTTKNGYTWHKISFNTADAYVIVGENSPNFTYGNVVELKTSSAVSDDNNTTGYIGDYEDFLSVLAKRESSNNYSAVNGSYLGKYQMGYLALQDAGFMDDKNNWTSLAKEYGVTDKNTFLTKHEAQEAAVRAYHKKLWGYLEHYGAEDILGKTYYNVIITESGLLAAAHLVGASGVVNAIKNNTNIQDGLNTPAYEYMSLMKNYDISEIK